MTPAGASLPEGSPRAAKRESAQRPPPALGDTGWEEESAQSRRPRRSVAERFRNLMAFAGARSLDGEAFRALLESPPSTYASRLAGVSVTPDQARALLERCEEGPGRRRWSGETPTRLGLFELLLLHMPPLPTYRQRLLEVFTPEARPEARRVLDRLPATRRSSGLGAPEFVDVFKSVAEGDAEKRFERLAENVRGFRLTCSQIHALAALFPTERSVFMTIQGGGDRDDAMRVMATLWDGKGTAAELLGDHGLLMTRYLKRPLASDEDLTPLQHPRWGINRRYMSTAPSPAKFRSQLNMWNHPGGLMSLHVRDLLTVGARAGRPSELISALARLWVDDGREDLILDLFDAREHAFVRNTLANPQP